MNKAKALEVVKGISRPLLSADDLRAITARLSPSNRHKRRITVKKTPPATVINGG